VESVYLGSSSRLVTGAHIFIEVFQDLTSVIFSVADDVFIVSETSVVTSSIEMSVQSFKDRYWVELRAYIYKDKCTYV
jgi:hypothetical protein